MKQAYDEATSLKRSCGWLNRVVGRVSDAWKRSIGEIRHRRSLNRARRELRKLSDWQLRDIGLTRADVNGEVNKLCRISFDRGETLNMDQMNCLKN